MFFGIVGSAIVSFYIAKNNSRPKIFATASIVESDDCFQYEPGTPYKTAPSGLCIQVVNDGLCKIKTSFTLKYEIRKMLILRRSSFVELCFDDIIIDSGNKDLKDIDMQSASGIINFILASGGRGKLSLEYYQLGSTKIRYANIDFYPIANKHSIRYIASSFQKYIFCLGDIGRLVKKLKTEVCPINQFDIPEDDRLEGDVYGIMATLYFSFNIAKEMTAFLYKDLDYSLCSVSSFGCPSVSRFNYCALKKYKECAKQLNKIFNQQGLVSFNTIVTYFPKGKMKSGIQIKIVNIIEAWEKWHSIYGVHYR
jgi:hypothetical protein